MITALEGILESRTNNSALVKVGPITLNVFVSTTTLSWLGNPGSIVRLHTYLYIREDNIALYGFASREELQLFQSLLTVSSIGPRNALGILSVLNPEQLVAAIEGGNDGLLSQVPGIGKKTAGRIILELKGKLEKAWGVAISPSLTGGDTDIVAALTGLGYSLREATQAAAGLTDTEGLDLEEKVKLALQKLAKM